MTSAGTGYPSNYYSKCWFTFISGNRGQLSARGLWDTLRRERKKEKNRLFSCVGIRCLHHRLSSLFQTWSMSIGFKMEPLRGNCKVMWFSININARGYATGALQHNLFSPPSDPARPIASICQSIQIDLTFFLYFCCRKKDARF